MSAAIWLLLYRQMQKPETPPKSPPPAPPPLWLALLTLALLVASGALLLWYLPPSLRAP